MPRCAPRFGKIFPLGLISSSHNFFFFLASIFQDGEGQTPLHYAVLCERPAIADLLTRHGADPNAKDNDGHSPHEL